MKLFDIEPLDYVINYETIEHFKDFNGYEPYHYEGDLHVGYDVSLNSLIDMLHYNGLSYTHIENLIKSKGYERYKGYIDISYIKELDLYVLEYFEMRF